jgi:hypothetical protein
VASSAWAVSTAARIGRRAGHASALSGRQRDNPFTGRGLAELADAWQQAYDAALTDQRSS